ncbi:hypothetical protein Dimus_002970 [Dionaea muscipula]
MGKSFQKKRIGPYRCCKGILCKDDSDSFEEKGCCEVKKEEAEKEEENQTGFDWEAVIDEAATEGESGSGEKFYDAEDENPGSPEEQEEIPAATPHSSAQQQEQGTSGVDPSGPTGREADFLKFQAEFERKRANQFHEDLEKAKAENAILLALLHQAQFKSNP